MIKLRKIDHVAVCAPDIDEAAAPWRALLADATALPAPLRELVASQQTDTLLLSVDGAACIELIAPKGSDSLVRFLAKRGPGLHHIAFEVEGLEEAIATLKAMGMAMIDEVPRIGARGHKVAFVHPRAFGGVLVELVEPTS